MFYWFPRGCCSLFLHTKLKITVIGKENIPKEKGGFILASNHVSNYDPPLVGVVFKKRYSFMAKEELFKNKLAGWLLRRLGAYPVKRGAKDMSALDKGVEAIEKGRVFVIFPEGTRSKTGELGRPKSGASIIAATAKVPVSPVFVKYSEGKGRKKRAMVVIGEQIPASTFENANIEDKHSIHAISKTIMSEIARLKEAAPDFDEL